MAGTVNCPHCGLINPDSAECCDCGYSFVTRRPPHGLTVEPRKGWSKLVLAELAKLTPAQQAQFTEEYDRRKKTTDTASLCWFFLGWHYAYLGKWGVQILFWITCGGFFLWWIVDLFRLGSLVRDHNRDVATDLLRDMIIIWGAHK